MKKGIGIVFMLSLVVVLASVAVYFVEDITTPIIEARQRKEIQEAVEEVYPDIKGTTWDVIDSTLDFGNSPITGAKEIKDGDTLVGIVYTVTFRGFSSDITYVVGVNRSGEITGYKTIAQNDTAGYGAQIADASNWEQFSGMLLNTAGSGAFDGLTGASVTTGSWKQSFADVLDYHKDAGVFPVLTDAEIEMAQFKSVLPEGLEVSTLTPSNGVKGLEDYNIDTAYVAKEGTTDKFVAYFETYDSYEQTTKILVVIDLTTNELTEFQVLSNSDTPDWGGVILDSTKWDQYDELSAPDLFETEFDGIGAATTTGSTLSNAMQRISIFHQAEFMSKIVYTLSELTAIYQEQLSVAFTSATVVEDVYAQKVQNLIISNIYDVKDELGNIDGVVYHVTAFGKYNNGPTFIQFLVGIDANGKFTGVRLLQTTDQDVLASSILVTDPTVFDSTGYFAEEIEGLDVTADLSLTVVDDLTVQIASIESALEEIGRYHDEDYPKRDDVVINTTDLQPAFPTATFFNYIYGDYDYQNGILNVYEAYDVEGGILLGYVYAGKYTGREGVVLYSIGVGIDGLTEELSIYKNTETWDQAEFDGYDGSQGSNFEASPWLANFEGINVANYVTNYTPNTSNPTVGSSSMVDSVSGVSTTTGGDNTHYGLIDSIYNTLKFHIDNSVGGAS